MPTPNMPAGFDFLDPDVNLEGLPVGGARRAAQVRADPLGRRARAARVASRTRATGSSPSMPTSRRCRKRSDVFSSWQNGAIPVWPKEMKLEQIELQRNVMLNMDAPHHTRLRKIISRGFTPRAIGRLEEELAQRAQNIAKSAAAEGTGDFVEQVSCELPLQAIAGLLGVPQDDRDKLFRWSNEMTGGEDPEYADVDPAQSSMELIMYAMQMADERGKNPDRRHRHAADPGRHRRGEALRRRVRLLRGHARGGGQRDHAQLHHPRHDRLRATTPTSGSCSRRSARRRPPTRSSAGRPRCRRSSAPPSRTPSWAACRSRRASGW